jgi:hypothetical protein
MRDLVTDMPAEPIPPLEALRMEKSLHDDSLKEADRFKWIQSEKAGRDLGEQAIRSWVQEHWSGYLRARWLEHLEGLTFWTELGQNDFGLLKRLFQQDQAHLLDRIVDRLKAGQENLHIILWAIDWHINIDIVIRILEELDINGKRLAHKFDG